MSNVSPNSYRSYLVRFWQSSPHEAGYGTWRASAQCVQTGQTTLFGDVGSLLTFLETQIRTQTTTRSIDNDGPAVPQPSK